MRIRSRRFANRILRFILIFAFCILHFEFSYGIWGISQDISTRGTGNVGYTGFLTLPIYLTTQARDTALYYDSHTKFQTYGGYIQYGVTNNLDVGLHGNSSINSSIGINLKYRPIEYVATLVGFDYIMNEMLLAPFGTLMTGQNITRNFSMYGGIKVFHWSNMIVQESPQHKKDVLGTVLFIGMHIFRKEGWKDQKLLTSFPTGLYVELSYPVNVDNKCLTIVLGLDGFLGLSFPRIQWQ
ncbi:MAG: hypothetical protein N2201_01350 [candidate division WOR-3 bacterium]|nr:hypothetical protein [candidate division WOR-3 bacterium]